MGSQPILGLWRPGGSWWVDFLLGILGWVPGGFFGLFQRWVWGPGGGLGRFSLRRDAGQAGLHGHGGKDHLGGGLRVGGAG